jgi:very-short-patch-repair endonuclease
VSRRGRPAENPERRRRFQEAFLAAFRETGIAINAARQAGIPPTYHYRWLKEDPEYARRFAELKAQTAELAIRNRKPMGVRPGTRATGSRATRKRQNQDKFLAAFTECGVAREAAEASGVPLGTHTHWLRADEDYRRRWQGIQDQTAELRQQRISERLSAAGKARWADPDERAAWGEYQRGTWTPEKRAAVGQRARKRMADPEFKARWEEANRAGRGTPEARAANSERMNRLWTDPGYRARHAATMASPETRQKISDAVKQQWADLPEDERKARMKPIRKVFKGGHKLTRIEAEVLVALGDRELPYFTHKPVGNYVADILVPSLRLVVECDGAWHHDPGNGHDAQRDEDLRALGYETLRLSEAEITAKDWTRLDAEIARLSQQ